MGRRIARPTLLLVVAAAQAQSPAVPDADPAEVLARVIAKVQAAGQRLPNFTCVETVTRETFRPAANTLPRACSAMLEERVHPTLELALRPYSTDRLRLDVTLVPSGEIFSWAGASRFNDAGIEQLVHQGPMGTGAFGGFLMAVFEEDSGIFTFVRNLTAQGRSLMEYSFQVPIAHSHYKVKLENSWVYTAYSGAVQVDAETGDVVRLTVQTAELPPATGSCMTTSTLDYTLVQIGESKIPLPTRVRQRFVSPTGVESENTTVFTACREYKGESTLTFLAEPAPVEAAGVKKTEPGNAPLPAGLRFAFALDAPIPTATAAAGDLFSGTLTEPMRDAKSKVLAPKGAVVEGRLMRVESFRNPPHVMVVLQPRTLEISGLKAPLAAVPQWQAAVADSLRVGGKRVEIYLPLPAEDGSGVFRFQGEHVVVPKGLRFQWRTVSPAGTEGGGSR